MRHLHWLSYSQNHPESHLLLPTSILLCFALFFISFGALSAQSVNFAGPGSSVNFGNANLCKPDESTPMSCNVVRALNYRITESGALGAIKVLTFGSPNLDFTLAAGNTCAGAVSAGSTCSLVVNFAPKLAGGRMGAVEIMGSDGKLLLTTPLYGSGTGPQIGNLPNGVTTSLPFMLDPNYGVFSLVSDGAGDVFAIGDSVVELPADGGPQIPLVPTFSQTGSYFGGAVIDGAGNLLTTSDDNLVEVPAGGGTPITFDVAVNQATYVAVDGAGEVFVSDKVGPKVLKLPFGCQSNSCSIVVAKYDSIEGIAADASGDLFVVYYDAKAARTILAEFPAGGGPQVPLESGLNLYGLALDGVNHFFSYTPAPYGGNLFVELLSSGGTPIQRAYDQGNGYSSYTIAVDQHGDILENINLNDGDGVVSFYKFNVSQFSPLNFGSIPVGSTKTLPLVITNTGNSKLVLSPSFESPSYKIVGSTPEACLLGTAAGGTCTLEIQFSALTAGEHQIDLTLGSNGAGDSVVQLQAIATDSK